jgi:putative flippase GtrA
VNPFVRWCKFNAVGVMGMAVQLGALALFNRLTAGRYLCASAAAVELTLLHNFVWHLHYTWRDRRGSSTVFAQLVRFHLSNGLVSMAGNLVLMRILVHNARLPLLIANGIAVLCCSIVNFLLGDCWAFAVGAKAIPAQACLVARDTGSGEQTPGGDYDSALKGQSQRHRRNCSTFSRFA